MSAEKQRKRPDIRDKKRGTRRERLHDLNLSPQQRALLQNLVARKRAREAEEKRLEQAAELLKSSLFDRQLDFFKNPRRKKLARCSRRAGKTHLAAAILLDAAVRFPGSLVPYVTLSMKNARRILWTTLHQMDVEFGFGLEFRANDLTATLSNGSQIILAGATDYEEIQKLRGPKYGSVVLDEVQSMKTSVCRTLVADILEPATMDYDGTICAFFTPSASASGYAFEIDHEGQAWERFHWTMLENPHLPKAKEWLEQRKQENNWDESTPVFRREYLGEWIHDEETLVYAYRPERNDTEPVFDGFIENYVIGVDLGFVDATAFTVLGFCEGSPDVYVVHAEKATELTTEDIARKIHQLNDRYEAVRIVADSGGLGKMIVEELNRRYELNVWPAEKSRKLDHIQLINSDFENGRLLIEDSASTEALRDELSMLEWNLEEKEKGRYIERDDLDNHLTDALLYGWRECMHYLHRSSAPEPLIGSSEYYEKVEQEMEQDIMREVDGPEPDWYEIEEPMMWN